MTLDTHAPQGGRRKFYKPQEIHREFGIPRDPIYRAIKAGELPALDMGTPDNPNYFVDPADLKAWFDALKRDAHERARRESRDGGKK